MGVKLAGIPSTPIAPADLRDKIVAIDAPNLMYAFYAVQMLRANAPRERALLAATKGLTQRVADIARAGGKSVVVFDGPPHPLKRRLLDARDLTRSFPPIWRDDYAPARAAARAMGVPVIDAPHDAEAQGAWMAREGLVDVVATTDWDALAMGAPLLLRNLSANPASTQARRWSLVRADDALAHLKADGATLALACILMGCDYHEGFDGIGPHKAMKLAAAHGGALDGALATLGAHADAREAARGALRLLTHPAHRDPGPLRWLTTDHDALQRALKGDGSAKRRSVQAKLGA